MMNFLIFQVFKVIVSVSGRPLFIYRRYSEFFSLFEKVWSIRIEIQLSTQKYMCERELCSVLEWIPCDARDFAQVKSANHKSS